MAIAVQQIQPVAHLPLVLGVFRRLEVATVIDRLMPPHPARIGRINGIFAPPPPVARPSCSPVTTACASRCTRPQRAAAARWSGPQHSTARPGHAVQDGGG